MYFSFQTDSYQLIFKSQAYCKREAIKVWKYQYHDKKIEKQRVEFNLTFRGNVKGVVREYHGLGVYFLNLFKERDISQLKTLLRISGHLSKTGPQSSESVRTVSEHDLNKWSTSRLKEVHRDHDIHIVPSLPVAPYGFDIETCRTMGLNTEQLRQVHGEFLRI